MKTALIVQDKFNDLEFLSKILDELDVTEVISGTSNGHDLLKEYIKIRSNIKISIADGHKLSRAYNAIKLVHDVVIIANGNGYKTDRAIANALNENKNLRIYAHEMKAFEIEKDGNYINLSMSGNLQKATKINGVYLDRDEVKSLIDRLQESLEVM